MSNQRTTTARIPHWQIGRWLWQWCSAKETLLVSLILIALAFVLSQVFPQVPTNIRTDPISYQEWVATAQIRFKNWTPLLQAIGIFNIYDTLWFRILLAALAFILLVSLGSQIGALLQPLQIRRSDAFYDASNATLISGTSSPTQVIADVHQAMKTLLGRVQRETDGEKAYLYGSRATWASASTSIAYLGLLLIISSLAINGRWGWQQFDVQLLPDEPVFVGPDASHRIQLVNVQAAPEQIDLEVRNHQRVSMKWGNSTYYRGFRYQPSNRGGPLIEVSAQRRNGDPLTLYDYAVRPNPVEQLRFTFSSATPDRETDRLFIVSQARVVGRLKWLGKSTSEDSEKLRFHLWVFREGGQTLLGEQEILANDHSVTATIGDITYTLNISRYAVIDIEYQPDLWVFRAGTVLLIVGLLGSLIPRQRMWSAIIPQATQVMVRIQEQSEGLSYGFRQQRDQVLAHLRAQIETQIEKM